MSVKLRDVSFLIYGKSDLLAIVPSRKLDSIHKLNAVDTIGSADKELFLAEYCGGEVIDNSDVLRIISIGLYLYLLALRLLKALGAGLGPFKSVALVLVPPELSVFAKKLSAATRNFETVGTGSLACGGYEHTCSAVLITEVCGNLVLNLNIVPLSVLAEAVYLNGHLADYPLNKVDLVRALVDKNSATFAFPSSSPASAVVVLLGAVPVGDDPVYSLREKDILDLISDIIGLISLIFDLFIFYLFTNYGIKDGRRNS